MDENCECAKKNTREENDEKKWRSSSDGLGEFLRNTAKRSQNIYFFSQFAFCPVHAEMISLNKAQILRTFLCWDCHLMPIRRPMRWERKKREEILAAMTSTQQQQWIERRMRLNFSRFLFVKNFRFLIFLLSYQTTNWMAQARAQYSQESHAAVWGRTGSFFVCLRWWVRVFDFFYLSKTPPV